MYGNEVKRSVMKLMYTEQSARQEAFRHVPGGLFTETAQLRRWWH